MEGKLKTGELIKKYRRMRKMTQRQLAAACGQTDSAIRNYELCNRTPGEPQIQAIAAALAISPEALREVPLESSRQASEGIFELDFCTKSPFVIPPALPAALRFRAFWGAP